MKPSIPRFTRFCLATFCVLGSLLTSAATSGLVIWDTSAGLRTLVVGFVFLGILEIGKPATVMIARSYSVGWAGYIIFVGVGAYYMHNYAVHQDASVDVPSIQAKFEREKNEKDRTRLQSTIENLQLQLRTARSERDRGEYRNQVAAAKKELKDLPVPTLSTAEATGNVRERTKTSEKTLVDRIVQMLGEYRFLLISETLNVMLFWVLPGHGGGSGGGHVNAFTRVLDRSREPSESVYTPSRTCTRSTQKTSRMTRQEVERWIQAKLPRVGDAMSGTYVQWAADIGCSTATVNKAVATLEKAEEIISQRGEGGRGTTLRRSKVGPLLKVVS